MIPKVKVDMVTVVDKSFKGVGKKPSDLEMFGMGSLIMVSKELK